jgi:hypothetical protein
MIKGVHTMFYSSEPVALRAFIRDKLGFSFTDVGGGWLIFDVPEADMGVHPAAGSGGSADGHGQPSGTHNISFYCEDVKKTKAELEARGVEFSKTISDQGFGLVTFFKMPGDLTVQLYQPKYERDVR